MSRQQLVESLSNSSQVEMLVIGGGATGLGTAVDAASRGLSVALFESHDFASGTSSRSTKLLHGGVRYLAQGNVSLVREALSERQNVMKIAPHLAQPLAFVMPTYKWWQKAWYGLGLTVYDWLAGKLSLGRTRLLNSNATQAALPGVQTRGLRGGVQYWDGQFDDARLGLSLALTAEKHGAKVLNYMEVTAIEAKESGGFCVTATDRLTNQVVTVKAKCVINAAGVWVDALRKQLASSPTNESQAKASTLVSPSQGVHVVVDRSFMQSNKALLIPKTEDGRVLFAVPWLGSLILGTTDTPRSDMPREPRPYQEELDFILREASRAFKKSVQITDVKSVWVGLRPLVKTQGENLSTKSVSREHTILVEPAGMITITGGKWTTYRVMAEEAVDAAIHAGLIQPKKPSQTDTLQLVGSPKVQSWSDNELVALTELPSLTLFGTQAEVIASMPEHQRVIGFGLTEAMVRYCARHEHAYTVEDLLARRWRVLFLDAAKAKTMAVEVAKILEEETGLDPQLSAFTQLCDQYLPTHSTY